MTSDLSGLFDITPHPTMGWVLLIVGFVVFFIGFAAFVCTAQARWFFLIYGGIVLLFVSLIVHDGLHV